MEPHLELRALLEDNIMPKHRERWGDSTEWDALADFQSQLSAHKWTAPAWPVEAGGRGLTIEQQIDCDIEFRRAGCPTRVAVYGVNNVGPTLLAVGTPEQKVHATAIAEATEFWCQGFSEPDNGSDLAGLRCKAERDGDDYIINGQKIWTSIGMNATHCMLLVRTDPDAAKHRGISALTIPLDLPGIERRPIKQINGESEFAELYFTDCRVPVSSLLGPENEGWRVTMTTLGFERAGVISMAGQMADDADETIRRIASEGTLDPITRDRGMQVWSRARILGWMGQQALAASPKDGSPEISGSVIKLAFSISSQEISEYASSAVGSRAMLDGPETADLLRSRASTIAGGTTEVMKNILGERALGLPREPKIA